MLPQVNLKQLPRLLRVKQWTKNLFVLAAFVFTKGWEQSTTIRDSLLAVLSMCLCSSAIYIANDIIDREKDRLHPKKKARPIASGAVAVGPARLIAVGCLFAGLAFGYAAQPEALYPISAYLGLQVIYNYRLRNTPVADVACIAMGFVLRVVVGAVAIEAKVSGWILLCTAMLALMLGFGKRRHEFHLQGDDRTKSRKSLAHYTGASLDMLVTMCAACAVMTYSVYSIESVTAKTYPSLIITTPFVIYGIARYLVIVFADDSAGEPETMVLQDKHLIFTFVAYVIAAVLALKGLQLSFLYQ